MNYPLTIDHSQLTIFFGASPRTPSLLPGLRREDLYTVLPEHTAAHLGSGDLRVLATPSMILFMERAARQLLAEHLPPGFSSVGARVDVRHLAPLPAESKFGV
jgi:predicted thioesterase